MEDSYEGRGENADMREVRIFFMQAKLSLMAASIFRANFILMLIQSIINTLLHVACMNFIYGSVAEIGGLNREEMLVLICTSMVINQLFRAFVNGNQMRFVEGIADGSFDHMLLRPIGILFQMNAGKVDFSSLMSALCPAIILAVNLGRLDRIVSFWRFILYLLLCLMGLAILSAFMVCLYSLAFRFIRVSGLNNIYYILMNISEKPQELFPQRFLSGCFLFAVPAIPIANIPVRVMLGRTGPEGVLIQTVVCVLFLSGAKAAVMAGIRRYTGGGG